MGKKEVQVQRPLKLVNILCTSVYLSPWSCASEMAFTPIQKTADVVFGYRTPMHLILHPHHQGDTNCDLEAGAWAKQAEQVLDQSNQEQIPT